MVRHLTERNPCSPMNHFYYESSGAHHPDMRNPAIQFSMPSNMINNPSHFNHIKNQIKNPTTNQINNQMSDYTTKNRANCENSMMTLSQNDDSFNNHPQLIAAMNRAHDNNDNHVYTVPPPPPTHHFQTDDIVPSNSHPNKIEFDRVNAVSSNSYPNKIEFDRVNTVSSNSYPNKIIEVGRNNTVASNSYPNNIEVDRNLYSMYHNIANLLHTNNSLPPPSNNDTNRNCSKGDFNELNELQMFNMDQNTPPFVTASMNAQNGEANKIHMQQLPFNLIQPQLYEPFNNYQPPNIYECDQLYAENERNSMHYPPPYYRSSVENYPQYMIPTLDQNFNNNAFMTSENIPTLSMDQGFYNDDKELRRGNCMSGRSNVQPFYNCTNRSNPVFFNDISNFKVPSSLVTQSSSLMANNMAHLCNNEGRALAGSNKNTQEGTRTAIRRLQRWYQTKYQEALNIEEVDITKAPKLLETFFNEIRDTRPGKVGKEYEQVTLTTYKNGIRRYFLSRQCPPSVDNFDIAGPEFEPINQSINNKQNMLKNANKVTKWSLIDSIDNFTVMKMCDAGIVGNRNPLQLVRIMWLINTKCFSIKGRLAHHKVQLSDFQLLPNSNGSISVKYFPTPDEYDVGQFPSTPNSNISTPKNRKNKAPIILSPTDVANALFVNCFQLYFDKRPRGFEPFYLTPKTSVINGDIWFNKVAMGKNSIGRIMNDILARKVAK